MPKSSSSKPPVVDWPKSVCRQAPSLKVLDFSTYTTRHPLTTVSPIDQYLQRSEALIRSSPQVLLDSNSAIANLCFVGIVSHTENYFRELFSALLELCPMAQACSAARDIKLGSVLWFKTGKIERGAFEGFSFASAENLVDTMRKYFKLSIESKSDSHALLLEFDRLCELRHAVVHSGGVMSGKNSLKLQFSKTRDDTLISLNFNRFQEAASICTALICSINIEFFKAFSLRWRDEWPKLIPGWNADLELRYFNILWRIFYCETDASRSAIAVPLTKTKAKNLIRTP